MTSYNLGAKRVLSTFFNVPRQWISQLPAVFEANPLLEQTMGDLWALVRSEGEESHSQLIDTSCL